MPPRKLTAAAIRVLKAKDERREEVYRDTHLPGLLLEVHPSGRKTFVAWGRVKGTGRAVRLKLGVWQPGVYDLADAREAARDALHQMQTGKDPAAEKRRAKAAGTFGDLVASFLKDAPNLIRPSTIGEWRLLLEHDRLAGLRAKATPEITRGDLIRLLDKIRDDSLREGGKGYSANRSFEAIRRVFSWAVQKDLIAATPCVGVRLPVQEQARRRYYSDHELGAVVRALDESAMSDAIRLALWTGVRIEQALGAPWPEFTLPARKDGKPDVAGCEWLIAANRTGNKSGVPWLIPLVAPAVEMLERRKGESRFVFAASGESGRAWRAQRTIYRIRERSGVEDFRPHDLRRTLNTWLASRAGGAEPQPVRDAILGHRPPRLEGTYNVHDYAEEKRAALERWAAHVERVAAEKPAKVVAMPGVRA